ncbi:uncharacterized protein [Neodiprion pinetum]|uniref:uncharacterized protein n=1 Tax=Neodiprion pinetum TaxID=441929 RepID=UPI001EDDDB57|nr:extensin [Neodiprion pinetum]
MKVLLVFGAVCAVSLARPEPPSYLPPSSFGSSSSYGAPAPSLPSASYGSPVIQESYGPPAQQAVIHKHVYVHVPPPEAPEYKAPKPVHQPPPPQKHYKIVFIKAPTPPTPTAPVLPPLPPQDEEKTLIYVLVKKPEEAPEVVLPTQQPTQPSKPEVYFIRYKTQKEQGGYPASVGSEYGAPAPSGHGSSSSSAGSVSDSYGAPAPSASGPY